MLNLILSFLLSFFLSTPAVTAPAETQEPEKLTCEELHQKFTKESNEYAKFLIAKSKPPQKILDLGMTSKMLSCDLKLQSIKVAATIHMKIEVTLDSKVVKTLCGSQTGLYEVTLEKVTLIDRPEAFPLQPCK